MGSVPLSVHMPMTINLIKSHKHTLHYTCTLLLLLLSLLYKLRHGPKQLLDMECGLFFQWHRMNPFM